MIAKNYLEPTFTVDVNDNLVHVKNMMLRHKSTFALVLEDNQLVGLITAKGILQKNKTGAKWKRRTVDTLLVRNAMIRDVPVLTPDATVGTLSKLLVKNSLPAIPISNGEEIMGVVTRYSLLEHFTKKYKKKFKVSDLMIKDIITVNKMHSIKHAHQLLFKRNMTKIIVEDEQRPIGLVTDRDLLFKSEDGAQVKDIMSKKVVKVKPTDDAAVAASLMMKHRVSSLPVAENKLVGIITRGDLLKKIKDTS
ncbi:CBS domain-containing protein [Candidatus Undinarchaeota archaeon]